MICRKVHRKKSSRKSHTLLCGDLLGNHVGSLELAFLLFNMNHVNGNLVISLFRYIKIQLDSESVRTKTKESG